LKTGINWSAGCAIALTIISPKDIITFQAYVQQVSPRRDVGRVLGGEKKATPSKRELRNRAKASLEREAQILEEVLNHAATGGAVIVPPLKPAIEARLGKTLALSTLYQMLSRHG
jgi:hypothetical protein